MTGKPDYARKHYRSQQCRKLRDALIYRLGEDFPRFGGERIRGCCADIILEEVFQVLQPKEHLDHGQAVWRAIAIEAFPSRNRRTEQTKLVPVVLDISNEDDIDKRLKGTSRRGILLGKLLRVCDQAYKQGALLSGCDLAEMFGESHGTIGSLLSSYEDENNVVVPRRSTLHDVGTGMTHKRIICLKRYRDGKTSDVIARETYHSIEAVDRYLAQFDRVRCCRREGMSPQRTAHILSCSLSLVQQYLRIDDELLDHRENHAEEGGEGGGSGRNLEAMVPPRNRPPENQPGLSSHRKGGPDERHCNPSPGHPETPCT
jgi:DNA-binding CsgD family transcriptional regulator